MKVKFGLRIFAQDGSAQKNSPFNMEQQIWIILDWGATKNITTVKRNLRTKFKLPPMKIPSYMAFKRLVEQFVTNGMVQPANPLGRPPVICIYRG